MWLEGAAQEIPTSHTSLITRVAWAKPFRQAIWLGQLDLAGAPVSPENRDKPLGQASQGQFFAARARAKRHDCELTGSTANRPSETGPEQE
jgi:hypothetical protein